MDEPFDPNDPSERTLDALLSVARFPRASMESEQRLRERWVTLSRKRRNRHLAWGFAAAAAIVLVIGGTIALMNRPESNGPKYVVVLPDHVPEPAVPSRSANLWERLLVQESSERTRHSPVTIPPAAQPSRQPVDVTDILRDMANPKTRAAAMRSLRERSDPPVDQLAAELRNPLVERRLAAARALGAVRDSRVTEILGQMLARDESRREVLAALMLSDDPAARDMLQSARRSRSIDAQCLAIQTQIKTEQVNPSL